ncbi:DUF433 domain-containing protein [Lusitaniella coriacea]|uniref:DUF433 domain-containing protein n=1 Tax=Lusitaniella coriacea TaxID=1983105 RepID=UPI003CF1C4D0
MTPASKKNPIIIRTERGAAIAGKRITIYDVLDRLNAGWTLKQIANWLPLTEEELNAVLSYIEENRTEVEAEYQTVLQTREEIRQYWEEKNQKRLAEIAKLPPRSGQEEIYAKLQARKAQLGLIP